MMRLFLVLSLILFGSFQAQAHHGWAWTTGGNIQLTGKIAKVELGLPHGIVEVNSNGDIWRVEVGQPWRNERAGIPEGGFAKDVEIKVIGEPAANIKDKRVKAEKIFLNGVEYDLYPSRD